LICILIFVRSYLMQTLVKADQRKGTRK
jgi:hypothetical protein